MLTNLIDDPDEYQLISNTAFFETARYLSVLNKRFAQKSRLPEERVMELFHKFPRFASLAAARLHRPNPPTSLIATPRVSRRYLPPFEGALPRPAPEERPVFDGQLPPGPGWLEGPRPPFPPLPVAPPLLPPLLPFAITYP